MAPRKRFKPKQAAPLSSGVAAEKPLMFKDKNSRKKGTIMHESETSHTTLEVGGEQRRGDEMEEEDRGGNAREDDGVMDLVQCGLCNESKSKDLFMTACGHQFCRSCIVHHVFDLTSNMTATSIFVKELMWLFCPYSGCSKQLQQHDLLELMGIAAVRNYEDCVIKYLDTLYNPLLSGTSSMICFSTTCDQQNASAVLVDKLSELSIHKVKDALELRGLNTQRFTKRSCIKLLMSAVGDDPKQKNPVWMCSTCDASWCGICGIRLPLHTLQRKDCVHSRMCFDGQKKYLIYAAIGKLKKAFQNNMADTESSAKKLATRTATKSVSTIWAGGTGFGGARAETSTFTASMWFDVEVSDIMETLLKAFVESEESENAGNMCPLNSSTCALVNRDDTLRQVLCYLATNDSMLDISGRRNVYLKMAAVIKVLISWWDLIPLLCYEIATGIRGGIGDAKHNSLTKKMGNIYKQATIMLNNMETHNSNSERDISLAKELCSCYEALTEKAKTLRVSLFEPLQKHSCHSSEPNSELLRNAALISEYKETLEQLQFKLVSMCDKDGNYKHSYAKYVVRSSMCIDKGGVHNHQRLLHISKEIASLSTTLPLEWESSIYVRVDQERLDVLKALIIGPYGTPYQNGIFIFDIFLPPDYPQFPPKVTFLTTGGGRVRFNPNLYETGVVCLSLLGTWDGPGWMSGKSTILQVLVSIQSLIFVKDPFYNEPGSEYVNSQTLAEKENGNHRKNTLAIAVLAAIRKPDSFFEEVIFEHFRRKKSELGAQCDEWVASATEAYKSDMKFVTEQIKAELRILCS